MKEKDYKPDGPKEQQNDKSFDVNHAVDQFAEMYGKYVDLKKFQEIHITKRAEIEAEEKKVLADINSRRVLMEIYLDKIFKERSETSNNWFKELDNAIATNDLRMIDKSCNAIVNLGDSNPLSHITQIERSRKFLESNEDIDL